MSLVLLFIRLIYRTTKVYQAKLYMSIQVIKTSCPQCTESFSVRIDLERAKKQTAKIQCPHCNHISRISYPKNKVVEAKFEKQTNSTDDEFTIAILLWFAMLIIGSIFIGSFILSLYHEITNDTFSWANLSSNTFMPLDMRIEFEGRWLTVIGCFFTGIIVLLKEVVIQ